jgi:mevalonate kinase
MSYFPGKLLLFGEYTVLLGGQALATPMPRFAGSWAFGEAEPKYDLQPFLRYLQEQQSAGRLQAKLNLKRFAAELEDGLHFDANIPVGYGAGSSGALCAAVYQRFALRPIGAEEQEQYAELRRQLAQLERFFHGNSSGTDPFICYVQRTLLLDGADWRAAEPSPWDSDNYLFFLIDTGQSRQTAPLVNRFSMRCEEEPGFRNAIESGLRPAAERAIAQYLAGQRQSLAASFGRISAMQLQHMSAWIPRRWWGDWEYGLESGQYGLKLCGAGGGGFLLGYGRASWLEAEGKARNWLVLPKT